MKFKEYKQLGDELSQQERWQEAATAYHQAIKLAPKNAGVHYLLAQVQEKQGDLEGAITNYQQSVTLNPTVFRHHKSLGDILTKQKRFSEAINSYQQAIQLQPDNANPYYLLGKVQEYERDLEGAVENYRQAISLNPKVFHFHESLGNVLKNKGNFAEAVDVYQQAIKLSPNNANLYHLLANLQEKLGDLEGAIENYQQAISLNPKASEYQESLINAINKQKSLQEEMKRCEKLLQQGLFSQTVELSLKSQLKSGYGRLTTNHPLAKYVSSVRSNPSWESGRNRIALLTSVRNEGVWLPEWIAYHLALGFDKIVIYANDCTDKSDSLLKELDRFNYIKYIENKLNSPEYAPRANAYFRALNIDKVLRDYEWAMVVDADEFLVLHQDEKIQEFVNRFDDSIDAIGINWRLFGSSGHQSRTDELVIQRFQRCSSPNFPSNGHIKSLARINSVLSFMDHVPIFLPGCNIFIYSNGQPVSRSSGHTNYIDHSLASIHHYVVKSYEEFLIKRERGEGGVEKKVEDLKYNITFFKRHEQHSEINSDALKWLDATQKILDSMLEIPDIANSYQEVLNWYEQRVIFLGSIPIL